MLPCGYGTCTRNKERPTAAPPAGQVREQSHTRAGTHTHGTSVTWGQPLKSQQKAAMQCATRCGHEYRHKSSYPAWPDGLAHTHNGNALAGEHAAHTASRTNRASYVASTQPGAPAPPLCTREAGRICPACCSRDAKKGTTHIEHIHHIQRCNSRQRECTPCRDTHVWAAAFHQQEASPMRCCSTHTHTHA